MKILTKPALFLLSLALMLTTPTLARSQNVGTSWPTVQISSAKFSIENKTGVTIQYQVKWGDNGEWKSISLDNRHVETHSYPLGQTGKAPLPTSGTTRSAETARIRRRHFTWSSMPLDTQDMGPARNNAGPKGYSRVRGRSQDAESLCVLTRYLSAIPKSEGD